MSAVEELRALAKDAGYDIPPAVRAKLIVAAKCLEAAIAERDALILSTGEHITVRSELRARVTALEKALADAKVSLDPAGETQWYRAYKAVIDADRG